MESENAPAKRASALLDFLFPGFGVFADTIRQQLGIDMGLYVHLAIGFGVLIYLWLQISDFVGQLARKVFLSTAEIRPDDEAYNVVMAWIAAQPVAANSRRFFVNIDLTARIWSPWEEDEYGESLDPRRNAGEKTLAYTPSFGTHLLWFRGRPILFTRTKAEQGSSIMTALKREEISLSCIGYRPSILKELLESAHEEYLKRDHQKTIIYRGNMHPRDGASWQRCMARKSRPFSTIYTQAGLKESIIEDMADYLSPETKAWYGDCGIPWRRGYLFAGPPGTGKSSLSFALAGHFGLKIYTVSLSSTGATEESLADLFSQLPQSCIVLFEDVDTAGLTHTRERPGNVKNNKSKGKLSLSGLLNLLDGVASQEGRILIMTTNHAEHLDKALLRPGRVDMTLQFTLADDYMAGAIFRGVFAYLERSNPAGVQEKARRTLDDAASMKQATESSVEKLATEFALEVPPGEFSPAEVQGYLIRHRREPEVAVHGARDWIQAMRRDKEREKMESLSEKQMGPSGGKNLHTMKGGDEDDEDDESEDSEHESEDGDEDEDHVLDDDR